MSLYSLDEIKVAAYNFIELADMNYREHSLWLGLAYVYDLYRNGEPKQTCLEIMDKYIKLYGEKDGDADDC